MESGGKSIKKKKKTAKPGSLALSVFSNCHQSPKHLQAGINKTRQIKMGIKATEEIRPAARWVDQAQWHHHTNRQWVEQVWTR